MEGIEIFTGKQEGTTPTKIIVTPKYHLAYAPLIEKLGGGSIILTPKTERGTGHQWIYEFDFKHWAEDPAPARFRLEILK